jgi:putative lipoprotein
MTTGRFRPALSRRGFVGAVAAAFGQAVPTFAAGRTLRGRVLYRERINLPPEALLEVRLVDVSLADAPTRSLAVTQVKTRHRMPIPYRLYFDDAKIQRGHNYALQARITVGGKLWFMTTSPHGAFTGGADENEIQVEFVRSARSGSLAPAGRWRAETIRRRGVAPGLGAIIEIAADGKVTGSGGCNRITSEASVAGPYMSFGPIVSTKMACPPDIMDQESNFLSALADTRLWRIDETRDKLILVDAHGVTVLRLARL